MLRLTTKAQKIVVLCFIAVCISGLLAGCAVGENITTSHPSVTTARVDDAKLGSSLQHVALSGQQTTTNEETTGSQCYVDAVRKAGLSPAGEELIVTEDTDDWGKLAETMRAKASETDAQIVLSQELRATLDQCLRTTLGTVDQAVVAPPVVPVREPLQKPQNPPNLTPSQEIRPRVEITSVTQLQPGLVTMLSSFGDARQAAQVNTAGTCLSKAVLQAKFSQDTLRFLAGGAPIGSGSVVDYLANDADKTKWASQAFVTTLSACIRNTQGS